VTVADGPQSAAVMNGKPDACKQLQLGCRDTFKNEDTADTVYVSAAARGRPTCVATVFFFAVGVPIIVFVLPINPHLRVETLLTVDVWNGSELNPARSYHKSGVLTTPLVRPWFSYHVMTKFLYHVKM
jgi:hypothetical protein